jgi:hypothetical protein
MEEDCGGGQGLSWAVELRGGGGEKERHHGITVCGNRIWFVKTLLK